MKPVTIIGGGLAGLSLGIGLRERRVPVTIYEAGHYPRHRVCGEFVSGGGQRALKELKVPTVPAHTAAFFSSSGKSWQFDLPEAALCVSRYILDKALAEACCAAGGRLMCGTRFQSDDEGVVHATGRRLHPVENGWRWFGLKAHATGIALEADLEMHLVPNGYVGICRLPEGRFNVCGLFRKRKGNADQTTMAGSLGTRLRSAKWIEGTSVAVSGLCFCAPHRNGECHIGDANAMIAPLTGNGMSMAFESAEAATEPLVRYAQGDASWAEAVQEIGTSLDRFRGRLARGKWLQWAAFHSWLLPFCSQSALAKLLFAATR
jgi:flavin-dependent dehydrogenase